MIIIKSFILFGIFIISAIIGKMLSEKYINRVNELQEMKNALNIFKTKIKFTYEPIPKIFENIGKNSSNNIGKLFISAKNKMENDIASNSWQEAVNEYTGFLNKEDKHIIKMLSKQLGETDVDGQVSQIEVTEKFLDEQINQAQQEKEKNVKLFQKLGITAGLMIVIILI